MVPPPRPPSVDSLARSLADVDLPHPLLVDAARAAIAAGDPSSARARAEAVAAALLRPVVNATGVLLHTNLGRAPLGPVRYANLEIDLAGGRRASRSDHAATLLARLAIRHRLQLLTTHQDFRLAAKHCPLQFWNMPRPR